jgi:5,6-dimethylbenzimidazole synthase
VDWVSIIESDTLSGILKLPDQVVPVAYLCVGHVSRFPEIPELESKQWEVREQLKKLIYTDEWGSKAS